MDRSIQRAARALLPGGRAGFLNVTGITPQNRVIR